MGSLGPTEIILIILVIVLLFGAKKLPELARGSGRALRIFKAETKGLIDDDEDDRQEEDRHAGPSVASGHHGQRGTPPPATGRVRSPAASRCRTAPRATRSDPSAVVAFALRRSSRSNGDDPRSSRPHRTVR